VIPGPLERNTGAGRPGFMKAMEEAQISVPENWIVQGDFEPESGYRAMQQILGQQHLAQRRSSAAAILWRWAPSARRMKWVCACRRTFR
jgi:DNA-binding LacI/PurR family transcriptional regulator